MGKFLSVDLLTLLYVAGAKFISISSQNKEKKNDTLNQNLHQFYYR
jgi:hypothetical protein